MNKLIAGLIFILLVSVIVSPVYSSPIFEYGAGTEQTIVGGSVGIPNGVPQIVVNGTSSFLVWESTDPGIAFTYTEDPNYIATNSYVYTDDPVPGFTSHDPQIVVISPTEIYVSAIVDDTGNLGGFPDGAGWYISITKIEDPTLDLGFFTPTLFQTAYVFAGTVEPSSYKLSAIAGEAHVVWQDDAIGSAEINHAKFSGLIPGFVQDGLTVPLTTGFLDVEKPDFVVFGTPGLANVTVTYHNTTSVNEIWTAHSSDSGDTFIDYDNIGQSDSNNPKIATDGTDVFVAWENGAAGSEDIYFAKSSDSGATFGSPVTISSTTGSSMNLDIAADSSKVYIAWEDELSGIAPPRDILFRSSSDGAAFSSVTNLSSDSGDSIFPQIAIDGITGDVHASWQDYSFDSVNGEIWIRSSVDNGNTFGGLQIITETPATDPRHNISASDDLVGVTWTAAAGGDIYLKEGDASAGIDVLLDQVEYSSDDAAVTVRNATAGAVTPGSTDIISVKITNLDTLDTSTNQTLTETGSNTGVFTGTVLLSAVNAAPGNKIRVDSYNETTTSPLFSTFAIIPSDVYIRFNPANYPLERGNIYGLTIGDPDANIAPASLDYITATVKSNANPSGIQINMTETGVNTGIFEGTTNIAFMNGDYTPTLSDTVTVTQVNSTALNNDSVIQTYGQLLSSTSAGPITITLTETSVASNTYSGTINFCSTPGCSSASTNTIEAAAGDFFTISSLSGTIKTNGIIDPDPTTNSRGAIQISCTIGDCGNAIAEYTPSIGSTVSTTVPILDTYAPGGGGGGISRAGLVVQAVGAISLFGGGGGNSGPPSFDDASFTLNPGFGGILSGDQLSDGVVSRLEVGKKSDISMGFRMPGGIFNLNHISLYANVDKGQSKYDSDTYIYFDKYKNPQITIHDPHGFFKSVNIDVTEPTKNNLDVNFAFDFVKSLDKSTVIFEAWNNDRQSALKEIPDLLDVDDPTKPETPVETETITPTTQERPPVPDWLRSNAAWWGKGQIDDKEFTNGISYLIQKQIIDVPELLQPNISPEKIENPDTGLIEPQEEFTPVVPDWVQNNALWWSEGQLTDDDFLMGIKYLLEKGIIQVLV